MVEILEIPKTLQTTLIRMKLRELWNCLCVDAVHVAGAEPGELAEDVVGEDVHPEEARQHGELHQEPADFAQHAVVVLWAVIAEMIMRDDVSSYGFNVFLDLLDLCAQDMGAFYILLPTSH